MGVLTPEQKDRSIAVMREYLAAPRNPDGRSPHDVQGERDTKRVEQIESALKPLVQTYLTGGTSLTDFKSQIDRLNKRHQYWGFKGIKGQMFFNMLVNTATDEVECDRRIKEALSQPGSEDAAKASIKSFATYVSGVGDQHVEAGGSKHGRPKVGSVPFFLSYFWQIQNRSTWPVFYTNTVNTLGDLNLWQPSGDLADDYVTYKHIHEELCRLFTEASGQRFDLYDVEHVFWFKGGNPYGEDTPLAKERERDVGRTSRQPPTTTGSLFPDSYVPPIVAALSSLSRNDPRLQEAAKKAGTSIERAFEKSVDAAFTILGYDTRLLGQGQGRVPDGLATAPDDYYAILWDAKVREKGYSMGTDDRAIREYVTRQSREVRRNRSLRNIYYVIVSSAFSDDFDDTIRSMKMETEVNEVVLLEAEALVAIVDARLRNPRELTLGPDGIQRLFSASGILSTTEVRELVV